MANGAMLDAGSGWESDVERVRGRFGSMTSRAAMLGLIACLTLGAGQAHAQWWSWRDQGPDACLIDCGHPASAPAPNPAPLALFTPRMSLTGGEALSGGVAVLLGQPFGASTALTLSAARFELTPGDTGFGVGAGFSVMGVAFSGRYLWSDDRDPDADIFGGVAFGGAYAMGALTLGAGVTLPLSAQDPAASTNLEVSYRAAPGLTVGGSLALSETDAARAAPDGAVSAGVSLRLDF